MNAVISAEDLRYLHERLPLAAAEAVKLTAQLCVEFLSASDKSAVVAAAVVSPRYQAIAGGISVKSLYRKCAVWAETGSILALVDKRTLRAVSGLAANREFVEFWQALCCENKRKTAPARRKLFALLALGEKIPGLGTWRDIFAQENGGIFPAPDMTCPYRAGALEPKGWSLRSLTALAPNKYALAAARHGNMAAEMDYGVMVKRTRRELQCCQVVQLDDMWYEHKVQFAGNKHAQRVVEYALMDALTAHPIGVLTKPVREREDGTKETLRSKWTRYLVSHLLCEVGIPESRQCLIMGEHGTASADGKLRAVLAELSGGHVEYDNLGRVVKIVDGSIRFGAGGLLSTPLGKGLYEGRPKGNPRYKGLLEGFHGLLKNELGDVRGHMGGGRGLEPEAVYGMDKRDEQLRAIAKALELQRPGILDRLQMPYIPYFDFLAFVREAYDRLDSRLEHSLEGWEECGFVVSEYRPTPQSPWVPWLPEKLGEKQRQAFKYLIDCGEVPLRLRKMSPAEAWKSRQGELKRLDAFVAPLVMGEELAQLCTVSNRLQMVFKEDDTLSKYTVTAILQDGRTLERGAMYKVWVNPLAAHKAYICDASGKFLGLAPVVAASRYDDRAALEKQLGLRQAAIAAECAKLQPVVNRMLREEAARSAANVREITGEDPALIAARRSAAALELKRAPALEIDDTDLL